MSGPGLDCRAQILRGKGTRQALEDSVRKGWWGGASGHLIYVCSNNPKLSSPASSWDFPRCALLEGKKAAQGEGLCVLAVWAQEQSFPFLPCAVLPAG